MVVEGFVLDEFIFLECESVNVCCDFGIFCVILVFYFCGIERESESVRESLGM